MKKNLVVVALACVLSIYAVTANAKTKHLHKDSVRVPDAVLLNWTQLPDSYHPASPEAVYKWAETIESSTVSKGHLDRFSTSAEISASKANTELAVPTLIGVKVPAKFYDSPSDTPLGCALQYSPDKALLSYNVVNAYLKNSSDSSSVDYKKEAAFLSEKHKTKDGLVGSNAFGVTAEYAWVYFTDHLLVSKETNAVRGTNVGLTPSAARDVTSNLSCLIVFSPKSPYVGVNYDGSPATIDGANGVTKTINMIYGDIAEVWLYDERSGSILSKSK